MPKRHRIREGECLSSIAYLYGFFPDTIWMHAENAALREKRSNPNTLVPDEDEIYIPDKTPGRELCATGRQHVFRRRAVPEMVRIRMLDAYDEPRANVPYRIEIDGKSQSGTTDADGAIAHPISPDAKTGVLIIDGEEYELELGQLRPVDTPDGVIERLSNLGYDLTDELRAWQRFQVDHKLEKTTGLDPATVAKLEEVHRS